MSEEKAPYQASDSTSKAALVVPEWLFSGPTSMGIRFCIVDEVAEQDHDGHGDLDAMRLEAVIPMEPENVYLVGAHFTFMSEFGYPYDFWEHRAVQMQESGVPLVRETTDEEDKIIEASEVEYEEDDSEEDEE